MSRTETQSRSDILGTNGTPRAIAVDDTGYWFMHRFKVASSDTILTTPAAHAARTSSALAADKVFPTNGSKLIQVAAWGNAENATATLTFVGWKPGLVSSGVADASKFVAAANGHYLGVVAVTFGSLLTQNINPVSQAAVSATDFYRADTMVKTLTSGGKDIGRVNIIDGDGDNRAAVCEFDPQGCQDVYVYITLGTATAVSVALSRC